MAEILGQIKDMALELELSKLELFCLILAVFLVYRLPTILEHRREMSKIRLDFKLKSDKLESKIEDQRAKRKRKASKGSQKS